ncbi:DUF1129 family protein [Alteribacter aurantiacus]|uniref:DUF1129 family protein n=1 Tax=Alteribacter aurantiacus TaxID=254410 RepID=UPI000408001B|nr:DUF1129 family protein [Alteribacter aurantiacus]
MSKLSLGSEAFLTNLKTYLIASGKKEKEINETVEELRDHLHEAEKDGKDVSHITGQSPKKYMKELSGEMDVDVKSVFNIGALVIAGGLSFIVMGDAIRGDLSYSLLQIIGYPIIALAYLLGVAVTLKYLSARTLSKKKEFFVFLPVGMVPGVLFLALIFLNQVVVTPTFVFPEWARVVVFLLAMGLLIFMSIWSKTWILIFVALVLLVPEWVLSQMQFQEETHLIALSVSTLGGFALIVLYLFFKAKKAAPQ